MGGKGNKAYSHLELQIERRGVDLVKNRRTKRILKRAKRLDLLERMEKSDDKLFLNIEKR